MYHGNTNLLLFFLINNLCCTHQQTVNIINTQQSSLHYRRLSNSFHSFCCFNDESRFFRQIYNFQPLKSCENLHFQNRETSEIPDLLYTLEGKQNWTLKLLVLILSILLKLSRVLLLETFPNV